MLGDMHLREKACNLQKECSYNDSNDICRIKPPDPPSEKSTALKFVGSLRIFFPGIREMNTKSGKNKKK
jgi:hypothetical protein